MNKVSTEFYSFARISEGRSLVVVVGRWPKSNGECLFRRKSANDQRQATNDR